MRTVRVITKHCEPVIRSGNRIWNREWQVEKTITVGRVFDILRRRRGLRTAIAFWLDPRDVLRKKVAHKPLTAAEYLRRLRHERALGRVMGRYMERHSLIPLAYNVAFDRFTTQKPLDSEPAVVFNGVSVRPPFV